MNTTKILKAATVLVLVAALCSASYNAGKNKAYSQTNEYYNNTEALLDSINNWDESFMDNVMETDAYYNYEVSRDNLNGK